MKDVPSHQHGLHVGTGDARKTWAIPCLFSPPKMSTSSSSSTEKLGGTEAEGTRLNHIHNSSTGALTPDYLLPATRKPILVKIDYLTISYFLY